MGGHANNAPIVTDGLVFYVDAGNGLSYPGSGTTVTDLISGTNGTLTNGPTYSPNNAGLIVCDGINDYIDFDSFESYVPTSEGTFNVCVRPTDLNITSGEQFYMCYEISNNDNIVIGLRYLSGQGRVSWRYKAGGVARIRYSYTTNFSTSDFYLLSLTYSVTNNRMRAYSNGVLVAAELSIGGTWTGGTARFGFGADTNGSHYAPAEISHASIYNRELSAAEITQNYNALKNRFV